MTKTQLAIRAYADGWKIEHKRIDGSWVSCRYPFFFENWEYRVVPDENGWLPWYGGECPVDPDTVVEVMMRPCAGESGKASNYSWGSIITAYRVIEEKVDPYAKLKAAAKDPTKQIRCGGAWADAGTLWTWNRPVWKYEIRNKPTKMKLRAWVYLKSGNLTWKKEGHSLPSEWKRVPSEDKEIEVEE